jgi:hypothetical protein
MEKLATPAHHSKGFQRPLMIFTKSKENPKNIIVDDEKVTLQKASM